MAGLWYTPERPAFFTAAGGEASLGEIYAATRDAAIMVDNTFAARAAKEEAYRRRNQSIFELTGEKLDNPLNPEPGVQRGWAAPGMIEAEANWRRQVRDLAARRPQLADRLMPPRSIEDDALEISRAAEERFTRLAGSRDGAAKWLSVLSGGFTGSARDPLQVATWAVGGGPGAARSVAGRIAVTAFSEAAVNAGVELALSPIVQAYREKAGLEAGFDVALRNAAFAGVLGGLFGAGARGVGELLARGDTPAKAAKVMELPPETARALESDGAALAPALREALPLDARGAVDAAEMLDHLDTARPKSAAPEIHDRAVSAAHRALEEDDFGGFVPDAETISRIAADMAGPAPEIGAQPQSLVEFLIARGGVMDQQGELAAIGADVLTRKRKGKEPAPLDRAREAAEEAGYIGRPGEVQVTSVADLLGAIDQELRGQPVFAREDLERVQPRVDYDGELARIEDRVGEVARLAGPGVDAAIVREASEISLREGLDAFDALERVLIRQEDIAPRRAADSETLPGWSDAELEAAGGARLAEPKPQAGAAFDNPGAIPDALGFADDTGPFAPSWHADQVGNDFAAAVALLKKQQGGEVRGILSHPATGPIDLVWGHYDPVTGNGAGLAKIIAKHGTVVNDLPAIIRGMTEVKPSGNRRTYLEMDSAGEHATVRLDYDGEAKTWLLTAFRKDGRRTGETSDRSGGHQADGHSSSTSTAGANIDPSDSVSNTNAAVAQLMAERADRELIVPVDGGLQRFSALADDLQHDEAMANAIRTCPF